MIALPDGITVEEVWAVARSLPEDEAHALWYDWQAWARPEQMLPAGDWLTWLVLAGRGFGKTRSGAEAVREIVCREPGIRIALIGPTAADCRDVMVEGESGIKSVFPNDETPEYLPSKRLLRFHNGALGFVYSAEEPERLRGPQHHYAYCLAGDTNVLMADGSGKPISDVRAGDRVMARDGASTVTAQYLTRRNAEVFQLFTMAGRAIIGTSDHPVYVAGRGFVPIGDIQPGMSLLCASNVSSGMAIPGIATGPANTGIAPSGCTEPSGNLSTDRFPKGFISITSTATRPITGLRTSNCSPMANTAGFTWKRRSGRIVSRRCGLQLRQWRASGAKTCNSNVLAYFAARRFSVPHSVLAHTVLPDALMKFVPPDLLAKRGLVSAAEQPIPPQSAFNSTARNSAIRAQRRIVRSSAKSVSSSATTATDHSSQSGSTPGFALVSALSTFTRTDLCVSKKRLAKSCDVYDISTTGGEFFANGILVHNCDELAVYPDPESLWDNLQFGLRLGTRPRVIVTTTPKPLPFLKKLIAEPSTVVTRGSTFDNNANLPAATLDYFRRVYGGTRIGRQELDGEVLDEAEGALWRRTIIDQTRVRVAPDMQRIVIAIDPAVTSGENSDETGIVAAGLGIDGEAYVLADKTCKLPPDQWASRAISLFDALDGDRVIAETNNGGDLVESVLRTVRRNISYEKITASRGKVVRAEPVAALYEQGRVHHVGAMPDLEDEMVNFVPGALVKSPNRADALVWAISYLMLKPRPQGRALWVG